jgi:hypothetical protein
MPHLQSVGNSFPNTSILDLLQVALIIRSTLLAYSVAYRA